jgi:XTP/dITP diphosphohydrolase
MVPCMVEHAGLILKAHAAKGFPGGLTQPMWDALGPEEFLRRTSAAGEEAIARAVFGVCDGMAIETFVGETEGRISDAARGKREFYWDTVFCPKEFGGETYAEVAGDPARGFRQNVGIAIV